MTPIHSPEAVAARAVAMQVASPSCPRGPDRFVDREYLIMTDNTDMDALRAGVPPPLEIAEHVVGSEFVHVPDPTEFGGHTESGRVIPVNFDRRTGGYVLPMYLDDEAPVAGGQDVWGSREKTTALELRSRKDTLPDTLDRASVRLATGTMCCKHTPLDAAPVLRSMQAPSFLQRGVPHMDGTPRSCTLVRRHLSDLTKKARGPARRRRSWMPMRHSPVSDLPLREVVSAIRILAVPTLGFGEVVHDYLTPGRSGAASDF
jgi:acetoacetate decarboxylase